MSDGRDIDIRDLPVNGKVVARLSKESLLATRKHGQLAFFVESTPKPGKDVDVVCTYGSASRPVDHLPATRGVVTTIRVKESFPFEFVPYEELAEKERRLEITRVEAQEYFGLRRQTRPITDENKHFTPESAVRDITPEDLALDRFVEEAEPDVVEEIEPKAEGTSDVWSDPVPAEATEDIWSLAPSEPTKPKVVDWPPDPTELKGEEDASEPVSVGTNRAKPNAMVAISRMRQLLPRSPSRPVRRAGARSLPVASQIASRPRLAVGVLGTVLAFLLAPVAIPSADVTVYVHKHVATLHGQRSINPQTPGFDVSVVPAHASLSKQFDTNSSKLTPGSKPTVDISFTDNCGTDWQFGFDQRVETARGNELVQNSPKAVVIPADGQPHPVPYQGLNAGPDLAANTANVIVGLDPSSQSCLTATNPSPSQGGMAPVLKRYLSATQLATAQGELAQKAAQQNSDHLDAVPKKPGETMYKQPGAPIFAQDHNADQFTDTANVSVVEDAYGVVYQPKQLDNALTADYMSKEVGSDWRVVGGAPTVVHTVFKTDKNGGITFDYTVSATIDFKGDPNSISVDLRGRPVNDVQRYLKKDLGADKVEIKRNWPPFFDRMPLLWINTKVVETKAVQ